MAVAREEVIWAYRMLLGREPESEDAIARHMTVPNRETLRRSFLVSAEFSGNYPVLRVGRHSDVQHIDVETDSSPADLARMTENIAREWRNFGETEPHWSVITGEEFRPERIDDNLEPFYALGRTDIAIIVNALKRAGVWRERAAKALDFGCGVGRLSLALAPLVAHVTGVDISPAHLAHAERRAKDTGAGNVAFQAIETVNDLDLLPTYDLIISLIVLQHNPPPVMVELLRKLLGRLAAGGSAVIQLPTYIVGQRFTVQDYLSTRQPAMEMNAVPQRVVYEVVEQAGCSLLEVREDGYMGTDIGLSHTFVLQKRA